MNQTHSTTDKPQKRAAEYTCGVCGEPVEGDLLSFLHHTDQHILDALRELHPQWVEGDEGNLRLVDYYRAQLGHDPWRGRVNHLGRGDHHTNNESSARQEASQSRDG